MSMPGNNTPTPTQSKALEQLKGLIGIQNIGGRTLCCVVGQQGTGKTWLAKHLSTVSEIGTVRYISVNQIILTLIQEDPILNEIFNFSPDTLSDDLKRYGNRLHQAIRDTVSEQLLSEGLTTLDHLELMFSLGLDPVTTWYTEAVGSKRILLVLTGRMVGKRCRCGENTLTRGDQPIVELEG